MKNFVLIISIVGFSILGITRTNAIQESSNTIFLQEIPPSFPGGEEKLKSFIQLAMNYPDDAKAKKIEGKVFVQFIIQKSGEIREVEVMRSPDSLLSKAAIRIVKLMPNWNPGTNLNGDLMDIKMVLPIEFRIDKDSVCLNPQVKPMFPGGELKFRDFLIDSVKIPESFYDKSGSKRFRFYMIVEKDGTISNLKMLGDYNELYYKYYASILNKMPNWNPGEINNQSVRSYADFSASIHCK